MTPQYPQVRPPYAPDDDPPPDWLWLALGHSLLVVCRGARQRSFSGPSGSAGLLAGLVGGATILIGVLAAELLVRFRQRRVDLDTSYQEMQLATAAFQWDTSDASPRELLETYNRFITYLARIRQLAKWPIRDARAIVAEVDAISADTQWPSQRPAGVGAPPELGPVLGTQLGELISPSGESVGVVVNDAFERAAGYPTIEDWGIKDTGKEHPSPERGDALGWYTCNRKGPSSQVAISADALILAPGFVRAQGIDLSTSRDQAGWQEARCSSRSR